MTDRPGGVRVARVDDGSWRTYRAVRLAMLRDSPRAYAMTYAESVQLTDEEWRTFALGAWLWLAYAAEPVLSEAALGGAVGAVGMYPAPELPAGSTFLVGMWVTPSARGSGVADALVRQVLDAASGEGFDRVVLEVADDNERAVAFYARMGFLPTGVTGSLPWDETITETQLARSIR